MAESKSRLLYILQYLWLKTDAEHYATTGDILTYLRENDIRCDRKTIPGDIQKLCDIGIDIEEERSRENRYSLSSHLLTLPELKLLIDAVESSKFITAKKSAELIEKLSRMSSIYQAAELKSNLYRQYPPSSFPDTCICAFRGAHHASPGRKILIIGAIVCSFSVLIPSDRVSPSGCAMVTPPL